MAKTRTLSPAEARTIYWALTEARESIQDLTSGGHSQQAVDDSDIVLQKISDALDVLKNSEVPF